MTAPKVFCDLVETDEGEVAGFAVWFLNYSTWTGTHGIFLEDSSSSRSSAVAVSADHCWSTSLRSASPRDTTD